MFKSSDILYRPAPTIGMLYFVLSDGCIRPNRRICDGLSKLSKDLEYEMHDIGWYLQWSVARVQAVSAIFYVSSLFSNRQVNKYIDHRHNCKPAAFGWVAESKAEDVPNLGSYPLLQMDVHVRHGRMAAAKEIFSEHTVGIPVSFLGVPFIRLVLCPQTEELLWTHIKSLYAYYIQH
mgnify:CR=1 FL=1